MSHIMCPIFLYTNKCENWSRADFHYRPDTDSGLFLTMKMCCNQGFGSGFGHKKNGLIFCSHIYSVRRSKEGSLPPWIYWVPQKLPQIYTVIAYICIGKVAWFAVYICGNIWNTLYVNQPGQHCPHPLKP